MTIQTGGSSADTTYTTVQPIATLPTGTWFPNTVAGGASVSISGGVVTVRFTGTSSYMIHNNIRYSCLSSSGCEIVNRRVTRGSIRARAESGGSLIAERAGVGWTIRSTGMEIVRPRDGDNASATSTLIEGTLRVKPGGG